MSALRGQRMMEEALPNPCTGTCSNGWHHLAIRRVGLVVTYFFDGQRVSLCARCIRA